MIREGTEDHEYMKMLLDLGEESFARSQVDLVVTNTYTFRSDPAALYSARENMAERIVESSYERAPFKVVYFNRSLNLFSITIPNNLIIMDENANKPFLYPNFSRRIFLIL